MRISVGVCGKLAAGAVTVEAAEAPPAGAGVSFSITLQLVSRAAPAPPATMRKARRVISTITTSATKPYPADSNPDGPNLDENAPNHPVGSTRPRLYFPPAPSPILESPMRQPWIECVPHFSE